MVGISGDGSSSDGIKKVDISNIPKSKKSDKNTNALPPQKGETFGVLSSEVGGIQTPALPPKDGVKQAPPVAKADDIKEIAVAMQPIVDAVEGFGEFLSVGATQKLGRLAFGPEREAAESIPLISNEAKTRLADRAISQSNKNTAA